ncbi:MAG: hypothetical protein JHC98_00200 [Thermoleophilaceae bacterium]|nr:hypothetical protein [Thermoleophilaceae bacterium]
MSRNTFRRPSATMMIAVLALVVAVSGGGQAIADTTVSIAKQISGSSIKKGSITAKQIKSGTITAKQVKSNTLTGKQINEGTLGTVPSAGTAGSAGSAAIADTVGGTYVRTIHFKGDTNSGKTTVFEHGGYRVQAECDGATKPQLTVTNVSAGPSELINWRSFVSDNPVADTTFAFNQGVQVAVLDPAKPHGAATVNAAGSGGAVLSGQVLYDNSTSFGGTFSGCFIAGTFSAT